jgi:hypothetical protein
VPESSYSPGLRTAVVLCGAGTAGVYQAGVLRALAEAGVKVDLFAAHGAGVITALCGAIDGGARLWDPAGPWLSPRLRRAYRWRAALRAGALGLAAAGLLVISPVAILGFAAMLYALSLVTALVNLPNVSLWLIELYQRSLGVLFHPPILPTMLPRAVVLALLVVIGVLGAAAVQAARHDRTRRRWRGGFWWRLVGSPLEADALETTLVSALWALVRGASREPQPGPSEIGRRYVEMLADNFGQPGFREVLLAVHDLDARRDLVGALLPADARLLFGVSRRGAAAQQAGNASRSAGPREAEVVDFAGGARTLVIDVLRGALRLPAVMAPHACEFPAESYWRGESHRLCDRPELPSVLIDETSLAGVEQVILVSPAPPAAVPHGLRPTPLDLRARTGELLRSIETSALHDAWRAARTRFSGVFVIRPDHNPVGPFDFSGAYDPASDRTWALGELLKQGYEDTYRQFIEPIVAAGEQVEAL